MSFVVQPSWWRAFAKVLRERCNACGVGLGGARPRIFADIADERARQQEKWGDQTHPSAPWDIEGVNIADATAERSIAIELERAAKADCQREDARGKVTWWHIAWEELAEALNTKDDEERRVELVQLGAVVAAWIEDIDAKAARNTPRENWKP